MSQQQPGTAIALSPTKFSDVPAGQVQRAVFLPQSLQQAMDFADFMSRGKGVRPWMRGDPNVCLMVLQQAMRWGMDPYAVANKAYYTNETLCFESQLVNAVINTSGVLIGRLKVLYSGDVQGGKGRESLVCRVVGRLKDDPENELILDQALNTISIRNSPLWVTNPKLQLAYHATRSWARLYAPEVILGVYTPDEIDEGLPAEISPASPAPDRRDFAPEAALPAENAVDAEFEPVDEGKTAGEPAFDQDTGETAPQTQDSVEKGPETGKKSPEKAKKSPDNAVNQTEIPSDPLEWAAWERQLTEDVTKTPSILRVNELRREAQPALDAAPDDILDRIQDLFSDRIVELTPAEGGKK